MARIGDDIKFSFVPRPYQRPSFKARANGIKRGVCIWPRRHGKDLHGLNLLIGEALKRVGLYNYYWPTFSLAKKTIWKGMDREGKPFLNYIPKDLIADKNETELRLELPNGSIVQLVGTDNINQNVVGVNPVGCLFSEYPLQNPMAWELTKPILQENGGFAWFLYTPRGRNHGYRLYQTATENPESWFCSKLTILETTLNDGSPVMVPADVEALIKEGMDPDLAQQEFYTAFDAPMQGSYYGRLLSDAFMTDRVGFYPYTPKVQVISGWDIGIEDPTAIWYAQLIGEEIRLIDYYEAVGEDFFHYFKHTMERPWSNKEVWLPFDAAKTDWGSGKSMEETAVKAFSAVGVSVRITEKLNVEEGIGVVRRLFPRMTFHDATVGKTKYRGHSATDALASYHKKFNEDKQEFEQKPHHNWACMARDTMVWCSTGWRPIQDIQAGDQVQTPTGLCRVVWSGVVRSTSTWRVWQGIRATLEHRWFTKRGLVTTSDLSATDDCWTSGTWGLMLLAWCAQVWSFGFKDAITSATPRFPLQAKRRLPYIGWCMRVCMVGFQHAAKSIIETVIRGIPIPTIWKPCSNTNTGASINLVLALPWPVQSAIPALGPTNRGQKSAPIVAGKPITPRMNAPAEPAYDLEIANAHCYFVRGDDGRAYLVSNSHSADALRALCMGVREQKVEKVSNFYTTRFDPMHDIEQDGRYESEFELETTYT